jgi:zinc transporter ZupT
MLALIGAILAAGILGIFTDWLFMGVLFHNAYNTYPEVWRPGVQGGKSRSAILWASALGFVMSAAVIALCAVAGADNVWAALGVALLAWIAGPLVVIVINNLFVKIDHKITFAHSLGYLVRMLIAGLAAGIALPLS